MYIWHEDIIKKLCIKHLEELYGDILRVWDNLSTPVIIQDELTFEFIEFRLELAYRMYIAYQEAKKKGVEFDVRPFSPHEVYREPLFELRRELRHYKPLKSKWQQEEMLRGRKCCGY